MEKTKVKQVIREALAREPAIEWYLKSKKIYGHYVTLLALVMHHHSNVLRWNEHTLIEMVRKTVSGKNPLYIPIVFGTMNRRKIISNHSLQRDTILELYQNQLLTSKNKRKWKLKTLSQKSPKVEK